MAKEGIIKEIYPGLFTTKRYAHCPYCDQLIMPGLLNETKHWTECPKNQKILRIHETGSPLIDNINKVIKF